jgi:hypothetical protein
MDAAEIIIPIIAMLTTFGTIAFVVYIIYTTRNRERMALIERNADASIFASKHSNYLTLKFALLLIGVGAGIILGYVLVALRMPDDAAYPAAIFLLGGAGLFIAHRLEERMIERSAAKQSSGRGPAGESAAGVAG